MAPETAQVDIGEYKYGFSSPETPVFKTRAGLDEDVVREISAHKNEPQWMLDFRLKAYATFRRKPMPKWGGDLSGIDFESIFYYLKPTDGERAQLGRRPRGHQEHVRPAGHPRGREEVPRGRGRAVRVRGRLPQPPEGPRGQGRHLPRHRPGAAASTRTCSASTGRRSSRPPTTSSPRSTRPSGRAARSSTSRRASRSSCRCRRTSASTRRTWASSSGR